MAQGAITIVSPGVNQAYSGTSAAAALPNASNGAVPKYCRFASTGQCYVKLGTSAGVTATSADILVQPADSIIIRTHGLTHFAVIQEAAAGKLSVTPLEDQ